MTGRRRMKASTWLGIGGEPYNRVYLTVAADAKPPPLGSPDHKRTVDAIIAGVRAENQRAAIHLDAQKAQADYDSDADALLEDLMRSVETLLRDRYGESFANGVGDMSFADAMLALDSAVAEIPSAFADGIREWRLNNPKARLNAPEIEI